MFEILTTPSFNAEKLVCGEEYDYVTRTSFNQGILRKTGFVNQANINEKGTWSLGLLQMDFFYRKNPWYAGQFVRKIVPKIALNDNSILYFTTLFNKQKQRLLNVLVRDVDRTFSNAYIQLPTKDGKIDFEFMDACIRELEEERIRELSAYLTVSGLDNYELSSEEKEALDAYDSIMFGECKFKDIFNKIRIGDLFEIKPTKAYKLTNEDLFEKNGLYPVVTNSSVNNGITGYTNLSPTEKGNMITYSDTTTSDGIFYQPTDYVGYSHIQGLYPLVHKEKWKYKSLMYIVTCFRKSASGRFDYGNKFNRNIAKEMSIQLPTKDGKIDFEFMELLISAVQKLVIKDVVLYADEKIQSTKKIVKES